MLEDTKSMKTVSNKILIRFFQFANPFGLELLNFGNSLKITAVNLSTEKNWPNCSHFLTCYFPDKKAGYFTNLNSNI